MSVGDSFHRCIFRLFEMFRIVYDDLHSKYVCMVEGGPPTKGKRGMAPRMTLDTLAQIIAKGCWASLSVPVSLALSASSVSFGPGALSPDLETSDRPQRRTTERACSKMYRGRPNCNTIFLQKPFVCGWSCREGGK